MIRWRLLLTPFATRYTYVQTNGGLTKRHYQELFVFGIRIAHLHLDKP